MIIFGGGGEILISFWCIPAEMSFGWIALFLMKFQYVLRKFQVDSGLSTPS